MNRTRQSGKTRQAARLGAAGLVLILAGCGSAADNDWQGVYTMAKYALQSSRRVSLAEAAAIPYATLGVSIGSGQESIAVLATDDNGQMMWAIGPKIILVTVEGGRIQRTAGLEHNLSWATTSQTGDLAASADRWRKPRRLSWTSDFADLGVYSATITCDERPVGLVNIAVLGKSITTLRVASHCQSAALRWTFDNIYWVDPQTGMVWRSLQHIHPKLDPLTTEALRPPGG